MGLQPERLLLRKGVGHGHAFEDEDPRRLAALCPTAASADASTRQFKGTLSGMQADVRIGHPNWCWSVERYLTLSGREAVVESRSGLCHSRGIDLGRGDPLYGVAPFPLHLLGSNGKGPPWVTAGLPVSPGFFGCGPGSAHPTRGKKGCL
jgi:hypothetical protein